MFPNKMVNVIGNERLGGTTTLKIQVISQVSADVCVEKPTLVKCFDGKIVPDSDLLCGTARDFVLRSTKKFNRRFAMHLYNDNKTWETLTRGENQTRMVYIITSSQRIRSERIR